MSGKSTSGKQIKSKKRVRDYAEVFTAEKEVKAMCDLVPDWSGNVLEPACGTGNFLVEIARRKLEIGQSPERVAETIFGIDIQEDNVRETVDRLLDILPGTWDILCRNIVCGDFLTKMDCNGKKIWFLDGGDEE